MAADSIQPKLPVIGRKLRRLLASLFLLLFLLAVNSLYLVAVTLTEHFSDTVYQDYFYLLMFLLHLLLGLILIPLFFSFGLLHQRRARRSANRYAIGAGYLLFCTGLLLLLSGVLLTRFGFLEINDPLIRTSAYWIHVGTPVLALWLFVIHRLAGRAIKWRLGRRWGVIALISTAALTLFQLQSHWMEQGIALTEYRPSLVRVSGNDGIIPPRHLMQDDVCAECHQDIAEQSAQSMHRFSSFNNPAYRFSVEDTRAALLQRDGKVEGALLCASCHDQVPLFSGRFEDPAYDADSDPGAIAGITCIGCHGITGINSPKGNGAYDFRDPPRYPFAFSDNGLLQAVNRQLIKAKPAFHKRTLLKPVHRTPLFCSGCHKVHLPYELNRYRWLRGQDHYDSFLLSGVSGHRVDSFYYPEKAISSCGHCHMPLTPSADPAARVNGTAGVATVHNHMFAAANTAVPWLLQHSGSEQKRRMLFLQRAATVDIFGIREQGEIDGKLIAPIGDQLPSLSAGKPYLLEIVVRTREIGHHLTQGTSDSNELWLELTLKDGERVIGHSGALGPDREVDPWAYFVNSYLLDRTGGRIEKRDAHNIFVALYDHQIPPGAAATVHYAFTLPAETKGPVSVEASLRYRKFDTRFLRHVQSEAFRGNHLPIATLAEERVVLPVLGGVAVEEKGSAATPAWERWNDYGIGLLRKGKRELRQAEEAFRRVEALKPEHGALNLARVLFTEGRLEEAAKALERAGEAGAFPWTLAWYAALIDRELGNLDRAIANFEAVAATRFGAARRRGFNFSKDYRALVTLGRTLYERARLERGEGKAERRRGYLQQARQRLEQALQLNPEFAAGHHNMALVLSEMQRPVEAAEHRALHRRYKRDDQAVAQAVSKHRRDNPAADHAAEVTAVYALQRDGAFGLESPWRLGAVDTRHNVEGR